MEKIKGVNYHYYKNRALKRQPLYPLRTASHGSPCDITVKKEVLVNYYSGNYQIPILSFPCLHRDRPANTLKGTSAGTVQLRSNIQNRTGCRIKSGMTTFDVFNCRINSYFNIFLLNPANPISPEPKSQNPANIGTGV